MKDLKTILSEDGKFIVNHKTLCPFHNDKTPSLHVYDDHYHCFSCGAHGDVIQYIVDRRGITFLEACEAIGRPVSAYGSKAFVIFSENKRYEARFRLNDEQGILNEWLTNNNIDAETALKFGIGYDKNAHAITFPVTKNGNTLTIGRRYLGDDGHKWDFGKNNEIWKKGSEIYMPDCVWEMAREKHAVMLVEGITDAIKLYQVGVPAISILGCNISEEQIRRILALRIDKISLFFDPDDAGEKCTYNALEKISTNDKYSLEDLSVHEHRTGLDPADMVGVYGALIGEECCGYLKLNSYIIKNAVGSLSDNSLTLKPRIEAEFEKYLSLVKDKNLKKTLNNMKNKMIEAKYWQTKTTLLKNICKEIGVLPEIAPIFKTGYTKLDKSIHIEAGNLGIVGALTGCGKTTFLLNIIANYICDEGGEDVDIAFFALEMTKEEIVRALLPLVSRRVKSEVRAIVGENVNIAGLQVLLDRRKTNIELFDGVRDLTLITDNIKKIKGQYPMMKVVFIDHIHRISHNEPNPVIKYSIISETLANLAKDLGIAIICAAQLNRSSIENTGIEYKPLSLIGLKWSSTIEQDSDWVCLLNRPDAFYREKLQFASGNIKEQLQQKIDAHGKKVFITIPKNRKLGNDNKSVQYTHLGNGVFTED